MRKARFCTNYPMGYRMSTGAQNLNLNPFPHAENYYALALCVLKRMPSGKALNEMGIAPEMKSVSYDNTPFRQICSPVYILHFVCGVQQKELASLFSVSKGTLQRAVGLFRERGAT